MSLTENIKLNLDTINPDNENQLINFNKVIEFIQHYSDAKQLSE